MSYGSAGTMSRLDDEILVSLYHSLHIGVITELAASVLFFYDYALTFPGEVNCIWQRRLSGITALFALTRYVVLLERVARLIQLKSWRGFNFQQADLFCNIAWRWSEFATIVMYLSITVFPALRTYAVLSRYRGAFIFVLGVGVSGLIYGIYYATQITFQAMHPPFTGCGRDAASGDPPNLQFLGVGTISTMIIEVLALVLSWRETAGTMSVLRTFNMSTKMSYTALLWRDGTIYSVILVVLTVLPVAIPVMPNSEGLPAVMDTPDCSRYVSRASSSTSAHLSSPATSPPTRSTSRK